MKRKQVLALLLTLALLATGFLSGCGGKVLAAKVGDREITVQQLENMYGNSSAYATYYGYDLTTAEGIESFQDYLLDSSIRTLVCAYEAKQAGITLTDEQTAAAKETAQSSYDSTYQQFVSQAQQAGSSDTTAYANKMLAETLAKNGTSVGRLKKEYLQEAQDSLLIANHKEKLLEGISYTAEELKSKYDEELATQKALFTSDPTQYFTYQSQSTYGAGVMPLYVPQGLFRVKHILVADEATAKEVKTKLDAGEDFDKLLEEYGTDEGMKADTNKDGYIIGKGANFVEPFLNAALALEKEGDVSDIVKSDYGYHIIKRFKDEPSRELSYEEVQTAFDSYMQTSYQNDYYNSIVEGWMNDTAVVTRYPENYRSIGKSALEG